MNITEKNIEPENKALRACLEVGKLLTSTLDLQEILELIMLKVSELIDAQNWSLLLANPETGELTFEIVVGIDKSLVKDIRISPGEGIVGTVAKTGEPVILSNVKDEPRFFRKIDDLTGFKTESVFCIPLKTHGKVLGAIEIVNVCDLSAFELKYLPILSILSDYAAIAIENSHHCNKALKMSVTDEYTGLYNARFLHQVLDEMVIKTEEEGSVFAVVFVDIDNFKEIVDQCGHLLGSQVLKEIGQTILSCLSEKDIVIKYGGDEYVIIFPGRNREDAIEMTQNILQSIRKTTYLIAHDYPVSVTASFGIAIYPEDADTKKELLMKADNTMYSVKRSTKNGIGMN